MGSTCRPGASSRLFLLPAPGVGSAPTRCTLGPTGPPASPASSCVPATTPRLSLQAPRCGARPPDSQEPCPQTPSRPVPHGRPRRQMGSETRGRRPGQRPGSRWWATQLPKASPPQPTLQSLLLPTSTRGVQPGPGSWRASRVAKPACVWPTVPQQGGHRWLRTPQQPAPVLP